LNRVENWPGGVIFQRWILRPEVLNLDLTPLRIEPGRGNLIINPVQNSTALKSCNIYIHGLFNQKLEFHSGFDPSVCLFCFWFIMSQNTRVLTVHSPTGACLPDCWTVTPPTVSKMTPLPLVTFYRQFTYGPSLSMILKIKRR
jgi:hypothetical protein